MASQGAFQARGLTARAEIMGQPLIQNPVVAGADRPQSPQSVLEMPLAAVQFRQVRLYFLAVDVVQNIAQVARPLADAAAWAQGVFVQGRQHAESLFERHPGAGHLAQDGAAGGAILRQMASARVALEQALGMLTALDEDALCPRGRVSQRARYLRNILDNVYGQEVQPYLAKLDRRQRHLEDRLRALRAVSAGDNRVLDQWLTHYFGPGGQAARLESALRRHTERWQTVLGACGLMPGSG